MDKFKVTIYLVLWLLITGVGCKKAEDMAELPLTAQDHQNIAYSSHSRHTLDIYLPQKRNTKTPVILLLHGGSWFEGDKSAFTDLAKFWREKGYAAATMNYRFTNTPEKNIHPAQVNDIAKAIEFIASKSAEWKISADKFALQGASSGGHLALLYAYKHDVSNKVRAVISMAGPTDLTATNTAGLGQAQVVQWLVGFTFQENAAAYAEASPLSHISSNSKPTLLFHGKLDAVVPYSQAVDLKNRLSQFSAAHKLVLYEDTGHEVVNVNYMASFLAECDNWFKLHLK